MIFRTCCEYATYELWANYIKKHMPEAIVDEYPMSLVLNNAQGRIAVWNNKKNKGYTFESRSQTRLEQELAHKKLRRSNAKESITQPRFKYV